MSIHARVSASPTTAGGLPLVFVHGLLVSGRYMVRAATRLAPEHPVYALDLPGYGKSSKPQATPSIADLSTVLDHWMDAVGLERAVLVANSFGCQIATDMALRYPKRVERLILVGPTIDPHHHSARQQVARLARDGTREPLTYAPIITADVWDMGVPRALRMARVALADHIERRLPRVTVPTLIVRGGRDPLVPQRWAKEATRLLPLGHLVVLPGAGHVAHYNAPDAFVAAVRAFLASPP